MLTDPETLQNLVEKGIQRTLRYRKARLQFIREFTGQYFKSAAGLLDEEPMNLLFSTVRAYVPNLVQRYPVNRITTEIKEYKDYAYMLGRGVDFVQKRLELKSVLRSLVVDAVFGIGIMESGLCPSDTLFVDGNITIDPGQIFSQIIDLDDFIPDPDCNSFKEARFLGHLIRVERRELMSLPEFDAVGIMELPTYYAKQSKKAEDLTKKDTGVTESNDKLDEYVEIVKVWIPKTNQIIYMGNPESKKSKNFLAVKDFYGPRKGPYTFLMLTPPVPQNPFPVAPISVWFDLHRIVNKVMSKMLKRIDSQKDVVTYRPAYSDLATELEESDDMKYLASDDPNAVQTIKVGGIGQEYLAILPQLQAWYNYIAGNPDQIAGIQQAADTATQATILQNNATVSIVDMRDLIDDSAADISFHHAWYLHYDPLIQMPFIKREKGGEDTQLWLTPEQRRGDILEFVFNIKPRSMGGGLDPMMKTQRIIQFATNVVPAGAATAQIAQQLGIPFSFEKYLSGMAEELDILDWFTDVFDDPDFQERIKFMAQFGAGEKSNMITPQAISQNQGFPMARNPITPAVNEQEMSAMGQAAMKGPGL